MVLLLALLPIAAILCTLSSVVVANGIWICGCGKRFSNLRAFNGHVQWTKCPQGSTSSSKSVPNPAAVPLQACLDQPAQHADQDIVIDDEFMGEDELEVIGDASDVFPDTIKKRQRNIHDDRFIQLSRGNRWSNVTIDQVLKAGNEGLRLDEVRISS